MRKLAALAFALSSLALFAERDMAIYRGKLTSDLNANGNRITSVDSPLNPGDAANKEYVDSHGGGCDTNAVDALANSAVVTNALTVATTNRVAALETAADSLASSVSSLASSLAEKANSADIPDMAREAMSAYGISSSYINIGGSISGQTISDQYGDLREAINGKADKTDISATNPTFSNAVLAVSVDFATNTTGAAYVAVTNALAGFGFDAEALAELPGGKVYGSIGALLAALAAAVAWLKKKALVGGLTGGVPDDPKVHDFFTESNSLLNGRLAYSRNATGLKDRAFNTLSFDGTEFNLSTALAAVTPTASGQPRDLLIVATATAATTISFTAGTIKGDKPTIDSSGTWLITLTEYASGVWYCRQIKMEDAA